MKNALAPILAILDDGLRLYRRSFVTFAILAALGTVPLIVLFIGGSLVSALIEPAFGTLFTLGGLVLGLPLMIYAIGALSRAAAVVQAGGQPTLRDALAIHPLRALGMGCYGSVLLMGMNIAASMVSMICICPLYIGVVAAFGITGASFAGGEGPSMAVVSVVATVGALALVVIYVISLAVSGASYCGAVYCLQPFVHERIRFGAAMGRSVDLLAYRFGANLLAFVCASLVFGAISLAVALAVGLLGPLPLLLTLGAESPVTQVAFGAAWLLGAMLALPPLPIWMALLYNRRLAEREGGDLGERIATLATTT